MFILCVYYTIIFLYFYMDTNIFWYELKMVPNGLGFIKASVQNKQIS